MSVLPFKEDEDFRKHNQKAQESGAKELRQMVEEYESLDAQVADLRRDQKDLMTVAKAKGWDTKALRRLLAERKRDAADLEEERQLVEQVPQPFVVKRLVLGSAQQHLFEVILWAGAGQTLGGQESFWPPTSLRPMVSRCITSIGRVLTCGARSKVR
jgi:uncharacterized protein (UPF0335 family)